MQGMVTMEDAPLPRWVPFEAPFLLPSEDAGGAVMAGSMRSRVAASCTTTPQLSDLEMMYAISSAGLVLPRTCDVKSVS